MNGTLKSELGFYKETSNEVKELGSKKVVEGKMEERGSLPPKATKPKVNGGNENQALNFKTVPKEPASSVNGK
jgi:hypothetical protein